jgi:hypothetical protein
MWEKLKGLGAVVIFIGLLLLIGLLVSLFIHGGAWLATTIHPYLAGIASFTFAITLVILLPLSFVPRTRAFTALSLVIASYVFGFSLWIWSLLLTYVLWGAWAVGLGLFILGVGVVPFAMLATLFKGMWSHLGELVILSLLVFGTRAYSLYVAQKADEEAYE